MPVEPVAGSPWNGWPDVHGIGGRITVVHAVIVGAGDTLPAWNCKIPFGPGGQRG